MELVGALLPVDAPGDPRALIEQIVDIGRGAGQRAAATRITAKATRCSPWMR